MQSNVGTNGLKNERLKGYYMKAEAAMRKALAFCHFIFCSLSFSAFIGVEYFWLLPHFSLDHKQY